MSQFDNYIEDSIAAFTNTFYSTAIDTQNGAYANMLLSPLSIFVALAMTWAGSIGSTALNMAQVLNLPHETCSYDVQASIANVAFKFMQSNTGVNTTLANQVFVFKDVSIYPEYQAVLREFYDAAAQDLQTGTDYEGARKIVNDWVSEKTRGKIKELMPSGSITANTYLAIVNALYFKGVWETQFNPEDTRPAVFYGLDGTNTTIQMMFRRGEIPYQTIPELDAQAVKIPFQGLAPDWSMLIVLPNQVNGLGKVLSAFNKPSQLYQLIRTPFVSKDIILQVPKFKIGEGEPLNAKIVLQKMGMNEIFDPAKAELTNICACSDLYVSGVYHKAILEVDEKGATAAAGTGLGNGVTSDNPTPVVKVNRPFFVALISDNYMPVFLGHVTRPEKLQ